MSARSPKKRLKPRFYKRKGFYITLLVLFLLGLGALFGINKYLDKYRDRAAVYDMKRINDLEIPSLILDREGREIGRIFVENRSLITIADVPQTMTDALISGEDQRYFIHKGVDYKGILRAVKEIVRTGEVNQGASTLTQQLARNAYNLKDEALKRKENGIERKFVEAFLAIRIEQTYKKPQILEFYLNRVNFGGGYYGLRSAALGYFGKEPKELSAAECATLVGCIKNPTKMSPLNNITSSKKARDHVLNRMAIESKISQSEADAAKALPVTLNPKPLERGTSHLYERISETIREELGDDSLKAGGYKIHTTIDSDAQNLALLALRRSLDKAEESSEYLHARYRDFRRKANKPPEYLQGTVMAIENKTGKVLAYVGGRDYAHTTYDIIKFGKRGVGTAFLPFIYAAGFENGFSPNKVIDDEPMDNRLVMVGGTEGILAEWGMEIPNPSYDGKITARKALSESKISASVRFGNEIGLAKVRDTAAKFGLYSTDKEMLPRSLVGWEQYSLTDMLYAYAVIANQGFAAPKFTVLDRIEDRDGAVIYKDKQSRIDVSETKRIVSSETAWQLHSIMNNSLKDGSASGCLQLLGEEQFPGAGKTGTTHTFSDGWFLGYTSEVTCGVWTGYVDGTKSIYEGAFSKKLAMPVWAETMRAIQRTSPGTVIAKPAGLTELKICRKSGGRATPQCYEEIQDASTGEVKLKSSSYSEYLRDPRSVSICDVHAADGGDPLATLEEFSPAAVADPEARATLTIPIRSDAKVLLGNDPYGARLPSFSKSDDDQSSFQISSGVPINENNLPGEDNARLKLPDPDRLKIQIE